MGVIRKRLIFICIAGTFILGSCQSPTPVKIPQATIPESATSQAPLPAPTSTNLPPGLPTLPQPTPTVIRAGDRLTWVEAISKEPKTLDPALNYETLGSSLLAQIYDPLITYQPGRLDAFAPGLAEEVPTLENGGISAGGLTYTFKIRDQVHFHDGSLLTAADVAYSFQRGLLQGGTFSPQWLLAEAFFGPGMDDVSLLLNEFQPPYDDREQLSVYPSEQLQAVCQAVKDAIQADEYRRTVTFHLKQPWTPFLAALPGSWGSVTSQAWVKNHGGWDGSCSTWQNFYATSTEESLSTPLGVMAMGTGPYQLDHWTRGEEIVLSLNSAYWQSAPVGAPRLEKITLNFVPEFSTRLEMLKDGLADLVDVPRGEEDLLEPLVGEVCPGDLGTCAVTGASAPLRRWEQPLVTSRLDVFFTFDLNTENNAFTGSGRLDGQGIPGEFFNDLHIRRAFAYCFDADMYHQAVHPGRGRPAAGLIPAGFTGFSPANKPYTFDLEKCAAEFKAASLTNADGKSLWETGFHMAIAYPIGQTSYQTIAQIWQQVLGQVNPKFVVAVTGIPWEAYVNGVLSRQLPVFYGRWLADTGDAHNWVFPYVSGFFASRQALPADLQRRYLELVSAAAQEQDADRRREMYAELSRQFIENASALLLDETPEQYYLPRYVDEWVANSLLPGTINWYATSKE